MVAGKSQRSGRVYEISAAANPRIKSVRGLALKKNRDETGTFLVEGQKLVRDAFERGWQIETLIYNAATQDTNSGISELAAKSCASGSDVLKVPEKLLTSITRKDNPQNVIAVVRQYWAGAPDQVSEPDSVWLALDRIRDPGNLGTIIRTADAAGVDGIMLVGETTDPYSFEASRASMGSIFNVPLVRMTEQAFLDWRPTWPGLVVGTHLAGATDFRTIDYVSIPILLLMGNEQQGLPENLASCCDRLTLIPMAGAADSLNLAIATGVMLFHMGKKLPPVISEASI